VVVATRGWCSHALRATQIVLMTTWTAADPLTPEVQQASSDSLQTFTVCTCAHISAWIAASLVPKAILVVWGVFLAISTRDLPSLFNESKAIGFCIYNIAFCGVIVVPLIFVLEDSPGAFFIMRNLVVIWAVVATNSILFIPKLLMRNDGPLDLVRGPTGSGTKSGQSGNSEISGGVTIERGAPSYSGGLSSEKLQSDMHGDMANSSSIQVTDLTGSPGSARRFPALQAFTRPD